MFHFGYDKIEIIIKELQRRVDLLEQKINRISIVYVEKIKTEKPTELLSVNDVPSGLASQYDINNFFNYGIEIQKAVGMIIDYLDLVCVNKVERESKLVKRGGELMAKKAPVKSKSKGGKKGC